MLLGACLLGPPKDSKIQEEEEKHRKTTGGIWDDTLAPKGGNVRRPPLETFFFFSCLREKPPISIESFLSLLCRKEARMTCPASREVSSSSPLFLQPRFSLTAAQEKLSPGVQKGFRKICDEKELDQSIVRARLLYIRSARFQQGFFVETFHFPDHNRLQHHFESERERARFSRTGGKGEMYGTRKGLFHLSAAWNVVILY